MLILSIFIFLVLSAFFSGSEIAFVSASKLGIELKKNQGSRRGRILSSFYDDPKSFLGTMLIGNNIALVIFTYIFTKLLTPLCSNFFGTGFFLLLSNTLIITIVILIFGEFLPKNIFRLYANNLLYFFTYPLLFFRKILAIPTWFTTKATNGILKYILREPVQDYIHVLSKLDLEDYIEDTITEHNTEVDKELLNNALNLNQVKVRECMIPRNEIVHVDKSDSIEVLRDQFIESNLSRIVIIDDDIENTLGYIHHQQLLENPSKLDGLILEIPFIPETMNVQDLMSRFIKESNNIAAVVDEFGGIAGLITLEDILEEIFGEIEDEHDSENSVEEQISEDQFLFSGRLEIDYLNEKYEVINIPEGEYHTLSGYLVMTSGNIPTSGDVVEQDGYRFVLVQVSDTKIEVVRVEIIID